jgi:O-antigen/teichoic acid export membrane protein
MIINKIKAILNRGETRSHLLKTFCVYSLIALSIIIIKILIARLYGQEELGIFTYFFSLVSLIFLFSSFSFPEALTQIIIKDPSKLKDGFKLMLLSIIPTTFIFTVIFLVITNFTKLNPNQNYFLLAVALYIITYTIHYITYSILRGFKRFVAASWFSLLNRILVILFILALFFYSLPFIYFLLSMSIALTIAGVVAIPKINKDKTTSHSLVNKKNFYYLSLSLFLMQVSFYSLRFVDALTIKYLVDFTSLGLYSAYSSITNVIRLIGYVFPMVVVPLAAINKYKLKKSFHKIIRILLPFSTLVLAGSYVLVPLLYGQEYTTTYLPIALVISATLLIIYSYFNSIFVGENSYSRFFITVLTVDFLISILINTGLNFWFISLWGIIGAPIATGITIIIKIWLNLYGIKKLRYKKNSNGNTTYQDKSFSLTPTHKPQ